MNPATISPFPMPTPTPTGPAAGRRMQGMRPLPTSGAGSGAAFPAGWSPPFEEMPGIPAADLPPPTAPVRPFADPPPPSFQPPPESSFQPHPESFQPPPTSSFQPPPESFQPPSPPAGDFTDDDLREALEPIMEQAVRKAVYAKENGIDTYLEPMLRATIRRALAEYSPATRPFQPPGVLDRLVWHVRALFTSRTYEEIFFEKTRRFQVEEVFLLDASTLALVSFASCDPARHASVKRVTGTAQKLAARLRDSSGRFHPELQLSATHRAIARRGRHVILVALVRGRANELVLADLEFSLRRIEDGFRDQFEQEGSALLHELQPLLEDCLLIQSPATSAAM